jgi:hypothetical protein
MHTILVSETKFLLTFFNIIYFDIYRLSQPILNQKIILKTPKYASTGIRFAKERFFFQFDAQHCL